MSLVLCLWLAVGCDGRKASSTTYVLNVRNEKYVNDTEYVERVQMTYLTDRPGARLDVYIKGHTETVPGKDYAIAHPYGQLQVEVSREDARTIADCGQIDLSLNGKDRKTLAVVTMNAASR